MNLFTRSAGVILLFLSAQAMAASADADRIVLPTGVTPTRYSIDITTDAAQMKFSGAIKIDIDVLKPTSKIVLNAAELSFSNVTLTGTTTPPIVSFDEKQQTSTLTFPNPVRVGPHTLSIEYAGTIHQHATGLFALDYSEGSNKKRALFTQFENSDARRFVPCWDEPARKAIFTIAATVPADQMTHSFAC